MLHHLRLKDLHDGMIVYAGETRNGVKRLRVLSHKGKLMRPPIVSDPVAYNVSYTLADDEGTLYYLGTVVLNKFPEFFAFRLFRKEKQAIAWANRPDEPRRSYQDELSVFKASNIEANLKIDEMLDAQDPDREIPDRVSALKAKHSQGDTIPPIIKVDEVPYLVHSNEDNII